MIKKAVKNDEITILNYCRKHDIPVKSDMLDLHQYMLVTEGEEILGISQLELDKKVAKIAIIHISENVRGQGLGDGILRASLNYLDRLEYRWVLIKENNNLRGFLLKEGLTPLNEIEKAHEIFQYLDDQDVRGYFLCEPGLFFKNGCKGCKR